MRQLSRCRTIALAMNSNTPTIGSLVRSMGTKKIEAYIKLWILDLNLSLDLKKPLKPHQIDQIAFRIVDQFRNLNIADINLIFTNAKFGEYKGVYDRITIPTVMKWFKQYFDDRIDIAADQSYVNHISFKERDDRRYKAEPKAITQAKAVFGSVRLAAYENREAINKAKNKGQ